MSRALEDDTGGHAHSEVGEHSRKAYVVAALLRRNILNDRRRNTYSGQCVA